MGCGGRRERHGARPGGMARSDALRPSRRRRREVPRVPAPLPYRARQERRVPGARQPRRQALRDHLRARVQRGRRPDREEAALPLLPGHDRALARQRGLQLHLPGLPELADRPRRSGRGHQGPSRPPGAQPAGPRRPQRLPGRRLDVQRADDLAGVHPRRGPACARARPLHGDGHQRLHHRRGAGRARSAHRRVSSRREGLQRRRSTRSCAASRTSRPFSRLRCAPSASTAVTSRSSPT